MHSQGDETVRRRRPRAARVVVPVLAAAIAAQIVALYRTVGRAQRAGAYPVVDVDFTSPDALVHTRSLSTLLRDLLTVPLARDLLGEDFVFYYDTEPDRLGLVGTLRRISYEHDVTWTDRLVASVFDEPADVLLWRGPKGTLDYWAIAMTRGSIAAALQQAATIAAGDLQLTLGPELQVDAATVRFYALEYARGRTLLVGSRGDRVVVLSHPGMLGDGQGGVRETPARAVARLLSSDPARRDIADAAFSIRLKPDPTSSPDPRSVPGPAPRSDPGDADHSIFVRLDFLSFGYQRFFPALEAVRFDFGRNRWSTAMLVDGAALPAGVSGSDVWSVMPANAALCTAVPVDWWRGRELAGAIAVKAGSGALASLWQEFDGPAAICWYERAPIHMPLVAARLKAPGRELEPLLTGLFEWSIRKPRDAPRVAAAPLGAGGIGWQRDVRVPFASVEAESRRPVPGTARVTLATNGAYVFFSPDADQVRRALDTAGKRYPSMADVLPSGGATFATISPKALAALVREEALVMLPDRDEPVFRTAAEHQLLPKLDRLSQYPPYRLTAPASEPRNRRWETVGWETLGR